MHETALVRDIVHRIEELARAAGAQRVTGAKIWLGALSQLSAEHFREHFVIEARDTLAAGAVLEIADVGRSSRSACTTSPVGERRCRFGQLSAFQSMLQEGAIYAGRRASSGSSRGAVGNVMRNTVPRGDLGVVVNRP